jgi:hypothetical protein
MKVIEDSQFDRVSGSGGRNDSSSQRSNASNRNGYNNSSVTNCNAGLIGGMIPGTYYKYVFYRMDNR